MVPVINYVIAAIVVVSATALCIGLVIWDLKRQKRNSESKPKRVKDVLNESRRMSIDWKDHPDVKA